MLLRLERTERERECAPPELEDEGPTESCKSSGSEMTLQSSLGGPPASDAIANGEEGSLALSRDAMSSTASASLAPLISVRAYSMSR